VDSGEKGSTKEWLQMRYCITTEEVQWAMKDWKEEWKIPVEQPKDKQPTKDKQAKQRTNNQQKQAHHE
jgi:hypothetical protein